MSDVETIEGSAVAAEEEVAAQQETVEQEAGAAEEPAKPLSNINPNMKWYVVHVYSGFEEHAKRALLLRIDQFELTDRFGEIFVPKSISERTLKSGKRKQVERTSYPGYILVQMLMDDKAMAMVKDTPKITGFVGNQRSPRPISDAEALRLTSPEAVVVQAAGSDLSFDQGESVKVTDGAFANFDGIVDEVKADKQKLRVLVTIFGRETPVELSYNQVKKLS